MRAVAAATPRLATFLDAARSRVARGDYAVRGPPLRSHGSLAAVLQRGGAIVAELKPASPSEGRLLPERPGAAEALLDAYAAEADAVSVLTEGTHFGGSPDLLRQAHARTGPGDGRPGRPLLSKDFVVDEAQLDCARHCGASAVLLIERALGPERREALVAAAHARGLEVLLEIFDARDWSTAKASRADLVGVNARDLETLRVDPQVALVLLGQVARERPELPVLALSGLHDRAGARLAWAAGARGVLVGTALLKAADPGLLLRSLRRPLAKTCGLRTTADLDAAAQAGADLVGIVVGSPGSPRDVPVDTAQELVAGARQRKLRPVLVTRAPDLDAIAAWCRQARPDFLQLHGAASAEWVAARQDEGVHVLFAVGPGAAVPAHGAGLVLDGAATGGGGRTHDWDAVRDAAARDARLGLVAGGLDAGNAAEAVRRSGAWGADASGGLESAPGRKDPARIAAFVQAVHGA